MRNSEFEMRNEMMHCDIRYPFRTVKIPNSEFIIPNSKTNGK